MSEVRWDAAGKALGMRERAPTCSRAAILLAKRRRAVMSRGWEFLWKEVGAGGGGEETALERPQGDAREDLSPLSSLRQFLIPPIG